jgi:hypothetical protein
MAEPASPFESEPASHPEPTSTSASQSAAHVIRVPFDGGPRHGRSVDLLITGTAPLPLMLPADRGAQGSGDDGLYELRSTDGGGTRYAWIDDLPVNG